MCKDSLTLGAGLEAKILNLPEYNRMVAGLAGNTKAAIVEGRHGSCME